MARRPSVLPPWRLREEEIAGRGALGAVLARRSEPKVDDRAPSDEELLPLVEAAGSVADHSALRPWRLIALRGEARERLGEALVEAAGLTGEEADRLAGKPLRAPLLVAVVASTEPHGKVPRWEQRAVAAGVAHTLSLLLDEAGWGVMWRTGPYVRSAPVERLHRLERGERLLGWLYVGGRRGRATPSRRRPVDPERRLTSL